MIYKKPSKRDHKGFFYLHDETVINSLSALESGKVDEIVSKTTPAREGGFSGEINVPFLAAAAGMEGGKKSSSGIEEEMVRTRTRFSVFEAWLEYLKKEKSIGTFNGWGPDALKEVESGDTIEFRADLSVGPLQTVLRLFLWFVEQAGRNNTPFTTKGEELKALRKQASIVRATMGMQNDEEDEIPLLAQPEGEEGPQVVLPIYPQWMIGKLGQLGGKFGIVAQVTHVVPISEEYPILRLTKEITPTPLEIDTLKEVVSGLVEPSKNLGISVNPEESVVKGPALILEPIAIYR